MCLTKGPQSLGSSAELGICSEEGLLSQVLEAFQRNNFAIHGKSQELGWVMRDGFWHNAVSHRTETGISVPHDAMGQRDRRPSDGHPAHLQTCQGSYT